jgi:alkanesulfonate monooxygenase SsuD/methylene tetrahydromethanopterin reductase-like flavin-dependent oxidoreductase (luciferase family)
MPPPPDADTEAALRAGMLCGTPDEVARRIRALRDIAGARFTFVGRFYFPGMDRDVMRRATRLFAEEVIPQLT